MNNEFLIELGGYLLGSKSPAMWIAIIFFSSAGSFVRLYKKSLSRDPGSRNTPKKFSGRFLLLDNLRSFLAGIIIPFLFFRLSNLTADTGVIFITAASIGYAGTQLDIWAGMLEGLARKNLKGK